MSLALFLAGIGGGVLVGGGLEGVGFGISFTVFDSGRARSASVSQRNCAHV